MLVLSRKESEKIMLGDEVVLTIVRISGDRVRLGIEAPSGMLILRQELDSDSNDSTAGIGERSEANQQADAA
jgi:carbon storage regulator